MPLPRFSLGIEEEFQSVDRQSGELRSSITSLLQKGRDLFGERLHTEFVQSMVELVSSICPDISAVRTELTQTRALLAQLMDQQGLQLISAGTHPTSPWQTQERTDKPRYRYLEEEYQDVIRTRVIFGLHIHIGGVDNKETSLKLINQLRSWLPHLLALSSNSPFWCGRLTGMKSYRSIIWQNGMPRSGISEIIPSLADFNRYVNDLTTTQCISSGKDIWWHIRPHFVYNTIEFRICDMPATLEDILALAALCQAMVAKLAWLDQRQQALPVLPRHYIEENLWRAVRYGLDANIADFARKSTQSMRSSIHELLDLVDDVVDDLGSRREIEHVYSLLEDPRGTGADRQIAAYQQRKSMRDVIRYLTEETMRGIPPTHRPAASLVEAETEAHLPAIDISREASSDYAARTTFIEADTYAHLPAIDASSISDWPLQL